MNARLTLLIPGALLLGLPARAYESGPVEVVVSDVAELYADAEVDSGWLPGGSPLAVRFQVVADGGAGVDMAGEASVTWPTDLNLSLEGEPRSGVLWVDASLATVASVQFDVFGYTWESEIDRQEVSVAGADSFDPFLLEGAAATRAEVSTSGRETSLLSYEYDVFPGVTVDFSTDMAPESTTGFEGVAWWLDDDSMTTEGDVLTFEATGQPNQDVVATFVGSWDSVLELVFTPSLSVCVAIFGCTELAAFDIPVTLATDAFTQRAPSVSLEFPLPAMVTDTDAYDFGEVEVGDLVNLDLGIYNQGELYLEGEAGLLGSTYFHLYPDNVLSGPGSADGVVVTFAPESAGTFEATLLLSTNDPANPTLEIPLVGVGLDVDTGDGGGDADVGNAIISSEVGGCGCAAGGGAGRGVLALALGAAVVGVRRRPRLRV